MKEFIDKLIERLEELQKLNFEAYQTAYWDNDKIMYINVANTYVSAITEVNELAEEYKVSDMSTGWIPCSERLPEKSGKYIVTQERYATDDRFHAGKKRIEVDYVEFEATGKKWYRAKFFNVIAWMPLPAPYTEGE